MANVAVSENRFDRFDRFGSENRFAHTYAEPLAGLRVSWGAILAGALTTLAVSTILLALALAIILSVTHANPTSLRGSAIAIGICSIATTLIGAFIGGTFAGYLPGNASRLLAGAHAFFAWGVAFLFATMFELSMMAGVARTTTQAATDMVGAAAATAGAAVGGATSGSPDLDQRALGLLRSLGYSDTEARSMVNESRGQAQRVLRGQERPVQGMGGEMRQDMRQSAERMLNVSAAVTWAWFGTWMLAGILAIMGGLGAAGRLSKKLDRGTLEPVVEEESFSTPTPNPV